MWSYKYGEGKENVKKKIFFWQLRQVDCVRENEKGNYKWLLEILKPWNSTDVLKYWC